MAQKHLFLPKLLDSANVAEPKQHGHWEAQDKRIIRAISDGIEVAGEASDRGVSSVPDAYARPLTFQSALDSAGHPLRERVTQEWRGLLSLLALHRIKPDLNKVTFTPVRFNQGRFARALTNLAPRAVRLQRAPAPSYAWTDFLLIKFDGVTLGAFSPTTLVFTSADYNQKLRDKPFPLKDAEGYLCPPPPSNREDLESVGEWVSWLKKEFAELANNAEGADGEDAVRVLNGQLDAWQKSIRRDLGVAEYAALDVPEFEVQAEPLSVNDADFLGPRAIYQLLLRPLRRDHTAAAGSMSDYALEIDARRMPKNLEHVVVIEANLLSQNLKLWPGIKPAELGPNPIGTLFKEASGTRINNSDIGKDKGLWVRPELYFLTPTLTKAAGPGSFLPGGEARANGGNSRYLLPLRKEILQFFTVDDIIERLKPTYTEENERVVFSMRLPLRNGRSVEIKKAYSVRGAIQAAGEGVLLEREIPVLELFPNYMGEFWARYYLLFSDTERLAARPVHYGTDYFYLADRVQRLDTATEHLKAELTRISGVDCFPEGIELTERGTGAAVGLVLVEKDRDMLQKSFMGSAVVGVDFGTSNTNVFTLREDQAEPLLLRFKTDYLRSLLAADSTARQRFAQAFFVPADDVLLPTPTALREYNPGVRKDLLLDYFLYFPDRPRYPDNVLVDLKWEEENTNNLNNYLEALVFVVMVELVRQRVGRIEFRCTYPKSFNKARESDYRSKWSSTLHALFARGGSPEDLKDGQKLLYGPESIWSDEPNKILTLSTNSGRLSIVQEPKFTTEGIAAGEFFSSEKTVRRMDDRANKAGGSICIDVGGGTTDYSIWFENEIKYDASVLLAGRQIAEVMARNPRIGDQLLSADANAALREAKGPKFASRMNYILRREHKEISASLARVSNIRDIVQLRRVLVVEFGALAFYAGHLALALNQFVGDRRFATSVASSGMSLHWGGNASKMLDWIDHGKFKNDGIAAQFLNNLFACVVMGEVAPEAERLPVEYQYLHQKQSAGQKNEAAGGVVVIDNMERAGGTAAAKPASGGFVFGTQKTKNTVMEGIVMGEAITLDTTLPPYELLTDPNGRLFQDHTTRFRDADQSQLDYFLEVLNAVGQETGFIPPGEHITLSPQERMAIRNNLRNDFARLATQEPSQRMIEPVFIMEVRYLLNIMLEKML